MLFSFETLAVYKLLGRKIPDKKIMMDLLQIAKFS